MANKDDPDDQEERLGHPEARECVVCAKTGLLCAASCGAPRSAASIGKAVRTGRLRSMPGLPDAAARRRDKSLAIVDKTFA